MAKAWIKDYAIFLSTCSYEQCWSFSYSKLHSTYQNHKLYIFYELNGVVINFSGSAVEVATLQSFQWIPCNLNYNAIENSNYVVPYGFKTCFFIGGGKS